MKALPFYPLYVNDFDESDHVMAMSLSEVGLYVLVLNESWKRGSIPDDARRVAVLIRRDPKDVLKAWAAVRSRYVENGTPGRLVNERQERERVRATNLTSTERVRRFRERKGNGVETVSGTIIETLNETTKETQKQRSVSVSGFELGLESSKKDGPQIEIFQHFEIVKRRHPGAVTRPNACREKYKELVFESTDPESTLMAIDDIQTRWIEYWKTTKQKPLGLLNYLFDGDCLTAPPPIPARTKSAMESV